MTIGEALTNMLGGYVQDISHISLSANWMSASGHFGEDECSNHKGQWCSNRFIFPLFLPSAFHAHGVFTDRYGQA
jgi:hypothetical protein